MIYKEDLEELKEIYPKATEFELKILFLREDGLEYRAIQIALGNPSKKQIRKVLLKYNPDLIEKDCNYHKL